MNRKINYLKKSDEELKGTFGIIFNNEDNNQANDSKLIKDALLWLVKSINQLYQKSLAAIERIDGHFKKSDATGTFNGYPSVESTTLSSKKNCIQMEINNQTETWLVINLDKRHCRQFVEKIDSKIGYSVEKDKNNEYKKVKIYSNDSDTEAKIFPHLFPNGKGYFERSCNSVTLAQYFRIRILNCVHLWRDDKYYLFYAYDRITRERIFSVNSMIKARKNLIDEKNVSNFKENEFEDYFQYGNCIPRSITGSKSYWKSKYYDLIALTNSKGIFGDVTTYWFRIECQNRGALHAHMLFWIKDLKRDLIRADLPTANDGLSSCLKNYEKNINFIDVFHRVALKPKINIINDRNHELIEMDPDDEYIFKDSAQVPKSRMVNVHIDLEGNKAVKRNSDIIVRTTFYNSIDGEINYYQRLLYNVNFRSYDQLIRQDNISKKYWEECILRELIEADDCKIDSELETIQKSCIKRQNQQLDIQGAFDRQILNNFVEVDVVKSSFIFYDKKLDEEENELIMVFSQLIVNSTII
ncbi:ATP-dependent DNA helicase pif1 [Brachionus plicatilis]|uniref:ATP-dependent DNA helicase pif1 n=1 Tax=Brachionus plicatilis TaxID=10195 RepID=A0A3M7PRQ0_BRAPC|nr:ATP-dependent DNA helicase pif1 [Brachionus plicatilis]